MASLATATYAPMITPAELFRRAACPADTFQCPTSLGSAFSGFCCQNGQTCALDANNDPACCPSGAVCTGTAPNTISTGTPAATVTQSASFVPNAYFSFPYAQTTFANSPACFSAETACSDNYQVCLTDLQGGGGGAGLTIAVPGGGGVTVDGGRNIGASATSVCSSLSSIACSAVASANCDAYGPTSGAVSLRVARSGLVALILGALVLPVTAGLIP